MSETSSSATAPEQPAAEQPAAEQPAQEQPAPEQPTPEQPAPEQPAPEQPAPEQPAPEQPAPEQPAPEQPAPEQPVPEQPTPEQPVPDQQASRTRTRTRRWNALPHRRFANPKPNPNSTFSAEMWHLPRTRGLPKRIKAFPSGPVALPTSLSVRTQTRRWRALPQCRFANPNPAAAWASPPLVCEPEAEPEPGGVRFRTAGLRTRTRTRWRRALPHRRSANPKPNLNPVVACASAPPVCEAEAEPEPGGGVRFRTAGLRTRSRLPAAVEGPPSAATCVKAPSGSQVVAWQGGKPNSSSPPHTGLGPVVLQGPLLAAALPGFRPLLQSSLHLQEDAVWGGAPVEDRIVVKYYLRNMCRIYVSLIMAPVRQFICVTEWWKSTNTLDLKCDNIFRE